MTMALLSIHLVLLTFVPLTIGVDMDHEEIVAVVVDDENDCGLD